MPDSTHLQLTRRRRCCLLLTIILALFGSACSATTEAAPAATPTLTAAESLGRQVFIRDCGACHSTADSVVLTGPSLAGVAARAGSRVSGQDPVAYLLTSILKPDEYIVAGFANQMPTNFGKTLTGEELDAVVAYLLTLK